MSHIGGIVATKKLVTWPAWLEMMNILKISQQLGHVYSKLVSKSNIKSIDVTPLIW